LLVFIKITLKLNLELLNGQFLLNLSYKLQKLLSFT
jgi:hypothetical protein